MRPFILSDDAANHLVASSIALIQWWLEHEMPYSPEQMGVIYRDLIYQPTAAAAFADQDYSAGA